MKCASILQFNSENTEEYTVVEEEAGVYTHSWEFDANVNGDDHPCRHYVTYAVGQGVCRSYIVDELDGKVIVGSTEEVRSKIKGLDKAAKINVESFISNIGQ